MTSAVVAERVGRAQRSRARVAPTPTSVTPGLPFGAPQRIAAGEHELAPLVRGVVARQRLVDRARGEPEVGRLAVRPPQPRQRVEQRPLEVLAEGRLPERAARLADADRRRDDRLVRAALRARARRPRACRSGSTARPRRSRTTTARARGPRTGRRSFRSGEAAGRARLQVAPSSPSRPTRFVSAIPSSMWRPPGVSCQWTSVWESSANQSRRSPTDQMPDLLIQPPRFVELATSGLTVTTRSATSGASCTRSTKKRPKACWVDSCPRCLRPSEAGTAGGVRGFGSSRASAAAAAAARSASGLPGSNGAHGFAASAPSWPASSSNCSTVSSAEWFSGWPSMGSDQPLIV